MPIKTILAALTAFAAARMTARTALNVAAERLHQQEPTECEFFWHRPSTS